MKRTYFLIAVLAAATAAVLGLAWAADAPADPFASFPTTSDGALSWPWERFAVYFDALDREPLAKENVGAWLTKWTRLIDLLSECETRLQVATSVNTADEAAEKQYNAYLEKIKTPAEQRHQNLRNKLLASNLTPAGMELAIKKMRVTADIFRAVNLPLQVDETKLVTEYDKICGAQTIVWDGTEQTLSKMNVVYAQTDRARREKAWRLVSERWLKDRAAIGALWSKMLPLRVRLAKNAGFGDYRSYRWKDLLRLDYTPAEVKAFHENIRRVVVPAAQRIYEKHRAQMKIDKMRPWDIDVDPLGRPALKPFANVDELIAKTQAIFNALNPQLGKYFETMRREKVLDLDNRKNKAPGGFQASFDVRRQPFIFMNAVGVHDDVQTLVHESGHSFHYYESLHLPWAQQRYTPTEFDEAAAMSMELLAARFFDMPNGFYSKRDAARARIGVLEQIIQFWPYMSVVDLFQHWVYEHPDEARDPQNCDRHWAALWDQFMKGVDWSGFEDAKATGWHRKLHIHELPFYYIEYGIAELCAVQVYGRALKDPEQALTDYRRALALGGTVSLPELFTAAGVKFSLDEKTLQEAVTLLEKTIADLEKETG
jgi:oligoendopeptidase F